MKGRISKKGSKFLRKGSFKDLLKAIHNKKYRFKSKGKVYTYNDKKTISS